jgi:lipid-A-disaccharide synthase
LLVDFGGFNLSLAQAVRKRMPLLPILYFISPQVWASRPWRVKTIAKTVTKMLVIFPFEEAFYRARGVAAKFVGNPLLSNLPAPESLPNRQAFQSKIGIEGNNHIVGIFPGSRNREVTDFLPITLDGAQQLLERRHDVDFVISQGNEDLAQRIKKMVEERKMPLETMKRIHLINSQLNYELMKNADVVWAKSGTTTLEVALFGTPMLILYRGLWLSYLILRAFIRVKRVGWPNLLAGESLVPELLQLDCRADLLVRYTSDLLDVPALRAEVREKLLKLRSQLGQGDYASNGVKEILDVINSVSPTSKSFQANV